MTEMSFSAAVSSGELKGYPLVKDSLMRQKMISDVLKAKFGTKIYKLSLSSGCTCPNRDGTIGTGGCTFCSEGGSGEFAAPVLPVGEQIRIARSRVDAKMPASLPEDERKYIAYFQSFTNTYGDPARLRDLYLETIRRPEIAILSIGTRPDCLPSEILDLLEELQAIKPVWVELGLQTMHEKTTAAIHRGYPLPVFEQALRELKKRNITVIVHTILGLPGESREDMLDTMRYLAALAPCADGIKLQQLQILKGTKIGEEYLKEPFPVMTLEEYCELVKDCLELLPEDMVVHRLTGDGPKALLIEPAWSADKKRVLNTMRRIVLQ